jgi:anaerobic selenocysteine-containing dehydrogenase
LQRDVYPGGDEELSEKITFNTCMGNGCHAGCIHTTRVKDGRIIKVERTVYPDGEEGIMCVKGVAAARLPYHPDRLKYPLKRAGKRGEGKWERITWEEAVDQIAGKIKKIRAEYRPESVCISPLWNSNTPRFGLQPLLGIRLRNLLQATEINYGQPIDSNLQFSNYFSFGIPSGSFADPRTLVEGNTKYMIVWGHNPAETAFWLWKYIREAKAKGAKLVDIGLLYDPTAEKADWWIPVKAGSDTLLALVMINCIISEKRYDEEYITKYTNGPFLVRKDNGKFLRESDIFAGGDPGNYIVWDTVSGKPMAISPHMPADEGLKPALFGVYRPAGIECSPVFKKLADFAGAQQFEKVEEITGVSLETIEKLAREYATAKPAAILTCYGLRYKNSGNAYRAMTALGAITGNIGILGGGPILGLISQGIFNAPGLKLNDHAIEFATEACTKPVPVAHSLQRIVTGEPYPIKAIVLHGVNLIHTFPHPRKWMEEILPNLDLLVVYDIFMTATAEYADYVLPDCTIFEREDLDIGYGGYITLIEKAIEPMYECRPPIYFWSELAKKLGFGEYFEKTMDEWMEFRFDSQDPSVTGMEPPLTLERLRKEKMIRANVPKQVGHPFLDKKFNTPSGRVEIYCEELVPAGDELPVFREQMESPRSPLAKKYPLVFNTANNKYFMHTMYANEESILKAYKTEPHVSINPEDARKRGIKEGDIVCVFNDRGSCKVRATITEFVPPGVVNIPHGWWPKQFIEGHFTNLLSQLASLDARDEAREIWWSVGTERARSNPSEAGHTRFAYSADTLFDCLCEVRKVNE